MDLFIISEASSQERVRAALRIAASCAGYGEPLLLFFLEEGVECLDAKRGKKEYQELLEDLRRLGARINYCAQDAEQRGVEVALDAESSSLIALGKLIAEAKHCFCF